MEKAWGKYPVNARMRIDYSNKSKPKVTFRYPDRKHQFHGSLFWVIWMGWFCLLFLIIIGNSVILFVNDISKPLLGNNYTNKFDDCISYYRESYFYVTRNTCSDYALNGTEYPKYNLRNVPKVIVSKESLFPGIFYLIIIIGTPFLIYFPFKKEWQKLYPKFMAWGERRKYKIFYPKDIKKDEKGIYVEIPLFSNIILEYNARKDFSKQLKLVEIEEYKFKYYKGFKIIKKYKDKKGKKRRKKLRKVNEWLWYARFYFKEKPKDGRLEVIFK